MLAFLRPLLLKEAIDPSNADLAEVESGLVEPLDGGGGGGGGGEDADDSGGGGGGGGGGGAEPDEPLAVGGVIIVAARRMEHAFNRQIDLKFKANKLSFILVSIVQVTLWRFTLSTSIVV